MYTQDDDEEEDPFHLGEAAENLGMDENTGLFEPSEDLNQISCNVNVKREIVEEKDKNDDELLQKKKEEKKKGQKHNSTCTSKKRKKNSPMWAEVV